MVRYTACAQTDEAAYSKSMGDKTLSLLHVLKRQFVNLLAKTQTPK